MPLQATSGAASYDAFGGGVPVVPEYIEDMFSTYLYTGNGSTQTITNGIDLSTKGGLVWIKQRNAAIEHFLYDTTRGATKSLSTNDTTSEYTNAATLTAFGSSGFTLGSSNFVNGTTSAPRNYVSWTFRKQPKFFDIVTWTGDGNSSSRIISHALGSKPGFLIIKCTSTTSDWNAFCRTSDTNVAWMYLNSTSAASSVGGTPSYTSLGITSTGIDVAKIWLNSPVYPAAGGGNASGETYVAYLYAHDAGGFGLTGTDNVISCGSYTGNGTSPGPVVTLGYEPQWVMIKNASSTGNWVMQDVMRGMPAGGNTMTLFANLANAETDPGISRVQPTATGFQLANTASGDLNASGNTYIYIAIRRGPMKVPTSGTSVFNTIVRAGTGTATSVTGVGFPPDFMISHSTNVNTNNVGANDKLRGVPQFLATNTTGAEGTISGALVSLDQDGFSVGTTASGPFNSSGQTNASWIFRRAPSFFDEVCYTGDGTADGRTFTHNLGATPQLVIVKRRSSTSDWVVMFNTDHAVLLNSTNADTGYSTATGNYANGILIGTNSTTLTQYSGASGNSACNASGSTYVAYLFATCAGVSKCFSYTGNGSSQTINCGFTGGARFVLIKRTDSTGDWYVWDSARGIVSGNDPHLSLNTTAAEVTTDDTIDTDSTGFVVNQVSATNVNVSSATYIGIAIA